MLCVALLSTVNANSGYFWQITDIHYQVFNFLKTFSQYFFVFIQPEYYEGASVLKNSCTSGTGDAGKFGSKELLGGCDTPLITLQSTFQFMKRTHPRPDFILYTGDIVRKTNL